MIIHHSQSVLAKHSSSAGAFRAPVSLLAGLLAAMVFLVGCDEDNRNCVNCPDPGDPNPSFAAGLFEQTLRITACEGGEVILDITQYFDHCEDGPLGEGPAICAFEADGPAISVQCTIAQYPLGFEGCTATVAFDLTGTMDNSGYALSGTADLSDIQGPCLTSEPCIRFEVSATRIAEPSGSCSGSSSNGFAQVTLVNGPLAGSYTTTEPAHDVLFLGSANESHLVSIPVGISEDSGFLVTILTPDGFDMAGAFDPSLSGIVSLDEGSGPFTVFYGDPASTTGTVTITSISESSISGSFDCTISGEFLDATGVETQTRTLSGLFQIGQP